MSEHDTSMSMNSLMEAIYGDHHNQYVTDHNEDNFAQNLPQFMQALINYLIQLCVTQGFADNVTRTLNPWIRQLKANLRNHKPIIEGFLKDFLRLFEQQTQKINKYGQKKLKYLTKTVCKQIFTQIMRTACDLKLESVNRNNTFRNTYKKSNYLTTLVFSIDRLFFKDKLAAFKSLKKMYSQGINKQQNFIRKLSQQINKLDKICIRKRKSRLWKAMSAWRMNAIQMSEQQSTLAYSYVKQFFRAVLPEIVKVWQSKPLNWVPVITEYLSNFFKNVLGGNQDINIEFLPNPNLHQHNSLDYSALSSHRSGSSQFSHMVIQQYLRNQQIKYDNSNRFLAIPIIAEQQIGLIKISWEYQLPIVVFNKTLRLVQLLKQIIQGFAKITTRLGYYSIEHENNKWHKKLFDLALKEQALQIKDFEQLLNQINLNFLQIYHDASSVDYCIKYGRQNAKPIPENIFKLIWEKLETISYFALDRENRNYQVMKLQNQPGFCRYSFQVSENEQNNKIRQSIIKCIVPLLTKNLGKIGCKSCNIKIQQLIPVIISKIVQTQQNYTQNKINYDYKTMMQLKDSKTVGELQNQVYQIIKKSFPNAHIYAKMLYTVDETKNLYAYRNYVKNRADHVSIETVEIPKSLANQNICQLEVNQSDKALLRTVNVIHSSPLFEQPEIYLYQNQKRRKLRIIPKKIGRKAFLMVGTYQNKLQTQIQQITSLLGSQIDQNTYLFEKKDFYSWASDILSRSKTINTLNQQYKIPQLGQLQSMKFSQIIDKFCQALPYVKQYFMWRVCNNNFIPITQNVENTKLLYNNTLKYLMDEPIKSHQNVKGAHYMLKTSKNYGHKLKQKLTYIPNFKNSQEQIKYAQAASNNLIQQVGQYTDPCFNQISQVLSSISQLKKNQIQFISVPITHSQKNYLIMLIYNRQAYIDQENFKALSVYLTKNIKQLLSKKSLISKQKSLLWLKNNLKSQNNIKNKKCEVIDVLKKFNHNRIYTEHRNSKLKAIVGKVNFNHTFKLMKYSLYQINNLSDQIKQTYLKNTRLLHNKIIYIFAFDPFITNLCRVKKIRQGICKFESTWNKIVNNITCPKRVSMKLFINIIAQFNRTKKQQRIRNRQICIQKICKSFVNIQIRNTSKFFIKSMQNKLSFKRSLKILQQQFTLMQPKSIRFCLDFLSGRLNLMISQHFVIPILVKIVNCGYQSLEVSKILLNENFIFVQNSSFAYSLSCSSVQLNKQQISKCIEYSLGQILPRWEINHRKHQSSRLKILYNLLQNYRNKNLRYIFNVDKAQRNKQNIQNYTQIKKKAKEEKQKMEEYQQICNTSCNIQNRQKHKKQIDQIRLNTNIIQNQLYKTSIQSRIKSKTNSAYRMLNILNKNNFIKYDTHRLSEQNRIKNQVQQFRTNIKQDRHRYVCQVLPTWTSNIQRILKKNYKKRASQFISHITCFYQ